MRLASFEAIASALEAAGVRYLVAGGLAVGAHGYQTLREGWIREKGMQVLQFWSDDHKETSVDVFVNEPFRFEEEYAQALVKPLHDALPVRFVSLTTLIRMKNEAGRPQDLADIEQLRMRQQE
jgi:hypothetical protein